MATTARCPSCSAPIVFAHAGSVSLVCPSCDSTVVRHHDELVNFGKTTRFERELSPIRVGAAGVYEGVAFEVIGVLRKGREGVRWNEWAVALQDGRAGWLSEGNASFQFFVSESHVKGLDVTALHPGETIDLGGTPWRVAEAASARVLASDGELPAVPDPDRLVPYADLRGPDKVGTLDADGTLYVGEPVELPDLAMRGLRPVAGWSDPAVIDLEGPELTGTTSLKCPSCAASVPVHRAGQSVTIVCASCGSSLEHDTTADVLDLVSRANEVLRGLALPLGSRGELDGAPWEVIGAVERYVVVEGSTYAWVEFLLYNPWRGFRWLVQGVDRHWSLVRPSAQAPDQVSGTTAKYRGRKFSRFSFGKAVVGRVVGELTWVCQRGEATQTIDYVSPPYMLSMERDGTEEIWSLGTWMPTSEVARAFQVVLPPPQGTAPHQPNPWDSLSWSAMAGSMAAVSLLGVLVAFTISSLGAGTERLRGQFTSAQSSWVSTPFEVSGSGAVEIEADKLPSRTVVSLVPLNGGTAADLVPRSVLGRDHDYAYARVPAGSYVVHVETFAAVETGHAAALGTFGLAARDGIRQPGGLLLWYTTLMHPFAAIALVFYLRSAVETERWSKADG